ncbi:MAG: ComF family protein [Actinomycetota bacterium]|nr:ComF family protein [Actinomycetota bacterium]
MELNPIPLQGNWEKGWALDLNTICKDAKENDLLIVNRTDIGEHLYRLKYFGGTKEVKIIGDAAVEFIQSNFKDLDLAVIIPVPPSDLERKFQPVFLLAQYIGKKLRLPVDFDYLDKIQDTPQLIHIKEADKRKEILKNIFRVKDDRYLGKNILLFDDLYSSGETLKAITAALASEGNAAGIYVLTVTKTRVKRK